MNILEIQDVIKQYHNTKALDGVSLNIKSGSIFGLLGPNGAGKTSLIRIITLITAADSGKVLFDGRALNEGDVSKIGYMPEERGLYKKMKVSDQLLYLAQLRGMPKKEAVEAIKSWFEKLNVGDWWNKNIEELSKGMQQKIQFIATVVHRPKLLILDEPFSGLDPINANLIKNEIHQLNQEGTTIIFSTHRMEQVEEICEDIALINKGKILLNGGVKKIKSDFKEGKYKIKTGEKVANIQAGEWYSILEQKEDEIIFKVNENHNSNQLLSSLIAQNVEIKSFYEILPGLDEIFIKTVEQAK